MASLKEYIKILNVLKQIEKSQQISIEFNNIDVLIKSIERQFRLIKRTEKDK